VLLESDDELVGERQAFDSSQCVYVQFQLVIFVVGMISIVIAIVIEVEAMDFDETQPAIVGEPDAVLNVCLFCPYIDPETEFYTSRPVGI